MNRRNLMIRRKRIACVGLAAAMSLPAGLSRFASTFADQTAAPSGDVPVKPSNADLLKQGLAQYKAGQFEESAATLEQVDVKTLSDKDRGSLVETLARAEASANLRKAARAEFERGEDARKANRMVEAEGHYNAVLSNASADEGTKRKAQEQLVLVQAGEKNVQAGAKGIYDRAVEEYKKGDWIKARADFNAAQQMGFNGGFLEASPADYLKKIDEGEKQYIARQAKTQAVSANDQKADGQKTDQAADDQKSEADQRQHDGKIAYTHAKDEYRAGNYDAARKDFLAAKDLGYQPGFLEGLSPSEYLTRMDQKQAEDAKADKGAAVASNAPTTGTPAANSVSGTATATAQTVNLATDPATAKGEVDLGVRAEQSGDNASALRHYSAALAADPTNADASNGQKRVQTKMAAGATSGGTTLTQRELEIKQTIQAINFKFNTAITNANSDITKGDFNAAQNEIGNAQAARDQDPSVFNDADLRVMDGKLASARSSLATAQRDDENRRNTQNTIDVQNQNDARRKQEQAQRQATIEGLIKISRTQIDEQKYTSALGVLDQILTLDPQNDYAIGVRGFVEDKAIVQEQRHLREERDYNFEKILNRATEILVPYDDIFRYPDNWPDISEVRDEAMKNKGLSKEDQTVQALLDRRLPNVSFPQIPFSDAIGFLRDITGANILVNWKALEAQNIDKTTEVSANLHDVKFSKVLDIILQQAGAGKLSYTIDDGVITISTVDELNKAVATRVYDIRDLLIDPNFDPNTLVNSSSAGSSGGATSSGGSSGIFGGGSSTSGTGPQGTQALTQQLQDIKKKIETLVDFNTWKDNDPNGYGQIDDFNNSLIVTQTTDVHNKVGNLLAQLRETQAVQVTVETRFLTIERHFLDDVGVNLGLSFNNKNNTVSNSGIFAFPDSFTNHFSPITISNGTGGFTQAPDTGVPGNLSAGGAEPIGQSISAKYGNFLDDLQVSLVVRAVEGSRRSSIVHAPRVTLQSGQGATIIDQTTLPYVSSLNATVSANAVAITPVISTATDGVKLTIQRAVVSADRKYVTLDLFPTLTSFLGFRSFTFQTVPTSPFIFNPNGTVVQAAATSLTVELANSQVTTVATRVTVPDGGTLLLGGQSIAGEVNLEAGVPGLSKIPFLKRLTTNTSQAQDEQILIILVKPTILISKEIEAKSFPMLSSNKAE